MLRFYVPFHQRLQIAACPMSAHNSSLEQHLQYFTAFVWKNTPGKSNYGIARKSSKKILQGKEPVRGTINPYVPYDVHTRWNVVSYGAYGPTRFFPCRHLCPPSMTTKESVGISDLRVTYMQINC